MIRTLVVIPAFNEEFALPGVLADLRESVPEHDVLVVDDGSTDATALVASREGVPVARLPFNLGVGGALRTGFRWAVENGYDAVVQFDGDGQHHAAEIPPLLDALAGGADMVIGSRFATDETAYQVGRVRKGAMRLLRIAIRLLTGRRFTDTSSGFRAFSKPIVEHFSRNYPVEYLGDTVEAVLLALYGGFDVAEISVKMKARAGGNPSTRNLKLIYHYFRVLLVIGLTVSFKARKMEGART